MATTYRFVETTASGTLTITDAEAAVHIILRGTATGFTVAFADATTFSDRRMFRITNSSSQTVAITNHTGSITDTLLAGNVLQADVSNISTEAGVWNFAQHVTGSYAAAGQLNTDSDLIQYARTGGRSGGQTLDGGTGSAEDLTLSSTAHGTKGKVILGSSRYDETNNRLGLGVTSPTATLHLKMSDGSASSAPIKFTDGTPLATLETGAFEMFKSSVWATPLADQRQMLVGCIVAAYDDVEYTNTAA